MRLVVALEIIWDYLDSTHEQAPGEADGRQLHLALLDAVDPGRPLSDWYRFHPSCNDGGYLEALVTTCRAECPHLPGYRHVRAALAQETWRAQVLALNHIPDPGARDRALEVWAAEEFPNANDLSWYELSAAASSSLVVHMLLALAADPGSTERDLMTARAAYWPWMSLAATMLDSYVDQHEDTATGNHSYITHYPTPEIAIGRIRECITRCFEGALALRRGERHAVIVACMLALYLSKDSARRPELRDTTQTLIHAGGSLTKALVPALRLWRVRHRQQAA